MKERWVAIYRTEEGATKASLLDDNGPNGNVALPYGVHSNQVADDCYALLALVKVNPDELPDVVINDEDFPLGEPNEDIPPPECEGAPI
jgi:hypothetical protein